MEYKFTYASLFAGIGGFESGLNKLGGRNVFASEIDKYAKQSYEALYGVKPNGDITQIESKKIPNHDLLTAGFPCQTFSTVGKRVGMAYVCEECRHEQTISFSQYADRNFVCELCSGAIEAIDGRGLMFFEVARVARDKQPKAILLENVKGLVGHDKGRTLDTIVRTLSEIGYVVDFDVLNSKFYDVPQNRERIFIVAIRKDIQPHEEWRKESRKGSTVVPKGKRRITEYKEVKTFNFDFPVSSVITKRLHDILENNADKQHYLDNEKVAALIASLENNDIDKILNSQEPLAHDGYNRKIYGENGSIAPSLTTNCGYGGRNGVNIIEELSFHEEFLKNGVVTTDELAEALSMDCEEAQCGHNRIRKLTTKECWRLQGFTDEQHDAVELAGVSSSQRYKQAGNAVTVNVIKAIGEKLLPYLISED